MEQTQCEALALACSRLYWDGRAPSKVRTPRSSVCPTLVRVQIWGLLLAARPPLEHWRAPLRVYGEPAVCLAPTSQTGDLPSRVAAPRRSYRGHEEGRPPASSLPQLAHQPAAGTRGSGEPRGPLDHNVGPWFPQFCLKLASWSPLILTLGRTCAVSLHLLGIQDGVHVDLQDTLGPGAASAFTQDPGAVEHLAHPPPTV